MKYSINDPILTKKDFHIENEIMPNDEDRFRIKLPDYSSIHITTSGSTCNWQNAHFHKYCKELYLVQKGKITIALNQDRNVIYKELKTGDSIIIDPMTEHNVYMHKNSMTFVIKFGDTKESDWYEAPYLDQITKSHNPN